MQGTPSVSCHLTAELWIIDPLNTESAVLALRKLATETIREPGCLGFQIHQDRSAPQRLMLWESFVEEAALAEHLAAAHTQEYFALDLTRIVAAYRSERLA
jgi:quinol monooxygenase YgiN